MTIRFDRGGEYLLGDFKDYLTQNGIVSQLTAPRTPQQNGEAERRNMTLLEMVRSMMSYSNLPIFFFFFGICTKNCNAYFKFSSIKISSQHT